MRDGLIRGGAVSLSLLLHGIWFVQAGGESGAQQPLAKPQQTTLARLTFTAPQQEIVERKPESKPEPIKTAEKAKPVKREIVQNDPEPEPPQEEVLASIPEAAAEAPMLDEGLIEQERQRYLADVMAHIEQHKWYPKAARRRGLEGEVSVRFILLPDGSTRNLLVENGPDVLLSAARKAVERAVPMPKPPSKVDCPVECEFRMRFSLNET